MNFQTFGTAYPNVPKQKNGYEFLISKCRLFSVISTLFAYFCLWFLSVKFVSALFIHAVMIVESLA
jgi:hypothetical protein